MISSTQLDILSGRFKNYIQSLNVTDAFIREHIDIKTDHTYRVIGNIMIIARSSGLSDADVQLAKIIALTHDIGRFQQFIRYRTFDDSISVNHAALGVSIIREIEFFKEILDDRYRRLIDTVIMNHNVHKPDPNLNVRDLLFTKLIRDADKVDIWNILTWMDVVFKILDKKKTETEYKVPDDILTCFRNGQIVPSAVSMNDYRLLRLSWIYDMNFPATFALILNHDYLPKILAKIPPSSEKDEIAGIILEYVTRRSKE
jgi:putative nucleotidyltransferase with HDIG domain